MTSALDAADWQADLDLIADASRKAGAVALSFFGQSPEVWWKQEGRSPVSAADYAANTTLEDMLRAARPGYGWLSEETDDDPARLDCETVFVVDPIDGTRGFIAGLKTWCVSVAVVHKGRPVAGCLVAPALEEEFLARADGPALKNGAALVVSELSPHVRLRIAAAEDTLHGFSPDKRSRIERVAHVPSLAYRIAMVADGTIDGTLVKRNSHDWDLAAADLILERAGGGLVDLEGQALIYNRAEVSHGVLCAANTALPDLLKSLIASGRG